MQSLKISSFITYSAVIFTAEDVKMDNVTLVIRGQEFNASKTNLSEYSDYFRAMFSGSYVENEKTRVNIDVIEANIMEKILQYMRIGLIDLSEFSITTIGQLACAANFLQVTELNKQIQYYLDSHLSVTNWIDTMKVAESATFIELERLAAAHGLLSFKRMKPQYIPTIHKLFWYLSHPYLDAETEYDVFKFGHEWIMHNEGGGDALLIILCCIDYKKLTVDDIHNMLGLVGENYTNSLAEKVIECLTEHVDEDRELFASYFTKRKSSICKKYTERVFKEVVNLVRSTIRRMLVYTPAIPLWILKNSQQELVPHCLYTYTKEKGFERWLEVADKNVWGWSVISWGLTKVVVLCGEYGKGSGIFMKDVKVYDILRKEWIQHGVELPPRRHAGVAIIDDQLYILGGVGGYRVVLDSAIVYDLERRTYRKIASLPDAIQNPAVCIHNDEVYTCGQKKIYKYEEKRDCWSIVVNTEIRTSCMVSFKGFLYCSQNYFSHLYRWKPDDTENLEMVTQFTCPPAAMCHLGDRLIVFTRTMCGHGDVMAVEEFNEDNDIEDRPTVLWVQTYSDSKLNDVAGATVMVLNMPPKDVEISQTHKRYLERFPED